MNLCIIGTGYVGLVSAACFAEMGNQVVCVDTNAEKIDNLNNGKIPIYEPGLEPLVQRNVAEGRLSFSTRLADGLAEGLFLLNCVGTPQKPDGSCDLTYVNQVAVQIGQEIEEYKIVVNKSTVPVGTADNMRAIIQAELDKRGKHFEFDVVSNPEFLKEGDAVNDFMKPDRVIVGTDNIRTAKLLEALYTPFARKRDKVISMSIRSAEMTKYAANCMLATKISFMNEIANICEKVGADVGDVRVGIGSDPRIGYQFIYPGVGYGGSCFPKDVKALIDTAEDNDYAAELVRSVDAVNNRQKLVLAEKVKAHFAGQGGLVGRTLAAWGLSFKANTDDMRDSAAIAIINELTGQGARVKAFDPVATDNARKIFQGNAGVEFCQQQYDVLDGADALLVITDWNQFRNPDFSRIKKTLTQPVIFDGRNLYPPYFVTSQGLTYISIGRRPAYPD